eukprot:TRINITY_DN36889_c0_g1_i2.p1 TRINITY_DN36889_c0_g1~~TRINITY_DN36889_c0_g1_i2.p1  ORF type:complete len:814 (-),score=153.73 TRINITY_DN36889_c0_g1_i2:145-2586(-)
MSWASQEDFASDQAPLHEAELPFLENFQKLKAEDALLHSQRQKWLRDIERWLTGQDKMSQGSESEIPFASHLKSFFPAAMGFEFSMKSEESFVKSGLISPVGPDPAFGALQHKCPEVEDLDPWPATEGGHMIGGFSDCEVLFAKLQDVHIQTAGASAPSNSELDATGVTPTTLGSVLECNPGDGNSSVGGGASVGSGAESGSTHGSSKHRMRRRQCWPSSASAQDPQNHRLQCESADLVPAVKDAVKTQARGNILCADTKPSPASLQLLCRRWRSDRWWNERCFTLHPDGRTRLAWAFLGALALLHDVMLLPLDAAFDLPAMALQTTLECMVTAYWAADILVNLRTSFFVGPRLETRSSRIFVHYARTWLAFDILLVVAAIVGYEVRHSGLDSRRHTALISVSLGHAARLHQALCCLRLLRLARTQQHLFALYWLLGSDGLALAATLCKLIMGLLVVAHVGACGWYALGRSSEAGWTANFFDSAGVPTAGFDCAEHPATFGCVSFWYAASWRWMLAQVNGSIDLGRGRTGAEMAYTGVVAVATPLLASALLTALVTRALIGDSFSSGREASRKRQVVQDYLQSHGVASHLQHRVRRHVAATMADDARRRDWEAEEEVLELMPRRLRKDLVHEVRMRTLAVHPLFRKLRARFPQAARHLCLHVRPVVIRRDEVLFKEGDPCSRMFFVVGGMMRYALPESDDCQKHREEEAESSFSDDDCALSCPRGLGEHVAEGRWLCEAALWYEWVNQGRLEATSTAGLLAIEASEFAQALMEFNAAFGAVSWYAGRFAEELDRHSRLTDLTDILVKSGWVGD